MSEELIKGLFFFAAAALFYLFSVAPTFFMGATGGATFF